MPAAISSPTCLVCGEKCPCTITLRRIPRSLSLGALGGKTQEVLPKLPVHSLMKLRFALSAMVLLAGLLVVPVPIRADQDPAKVEKKARAVDARTLLEKGRASGSWPEGMVIRVSACLGSPDERASEGRVPAMMKETWEFISGQVRRVRLEGENSVQPAQPRNRASLADGW